MKAVVFAYHNIGCVGIEELLAAGFEIAAVFTHADDPGENVFFRSVARLAAGKGIPVFAPDDVNGPCWAARIRSLRPEALFSFYYRRILKPEILAAAPFGGVNLHGSLLPLYRGRAPVNWAIIRGEKQTGVTLHRMVARPDAGPVIARKAFAIGADDTALVVHEKAARAAAALLRETLPRLRGGDFSGTPQDESIATCFPRRTPADGRIDWRVSSRAVHDLVRGVTAPYPGAFARLGAKTCFIWMAADAGGAARLAPPGTILTVDPLTVACGAGAVRIDAAQVAGGARVSGTRLARDERLAPGMAFGPGGEL